MESFLNGLLGESLSLSGIALAAVLLTAFAFITPMNMNAYGQVGDEAIFLRNCVVSAKQPEDPITQNTVLLADLDPLIVKTIHAEKQIYDCEKSQPNNIVIVDVTIYAEIYEVFDGGQILRWQSEVITCIIDTDFGIVQQCQKSFPSKNPIAVEDCIQDQTFVEHPQEMNTVEDGRFVKTVESQKLVQLCSFANDGSTILDKKVDMVIFQEIFQDALRVLQGTNPVVKKQVIVVTCTTLIDRALVESCNFRTIPLVRS